MADERIEQFDYGIQRIWRHDGRLVEIRTEGNMARDAIDTWAEVVMETARGWSAGSPILIFHNLSYKNQGITPYSMKRAEDTYSAVPDDPKIETYVAVLLNETLFTRMVSLFFRRNRGKYKNVHERVFTRHDSALAWLESQLIPEKAI